MIDCEKLVGALALPEIRYPRARTWSAVVAAAPAIPFPFRTITAVSRRASIGFAGFDVWVFLSAAGVVGSVTGCSAAGVCGKAVPAARLTSSAKKFAENATPIRISMKSSTVAMAAATSDVRGRLNVSTGTETSLSSLVAELGLDHELAPGRPGEIVRSCLDPSAAHAALGWRAEVPLAEGLRHTLAAMPVVS